MKPIHIEDVVIDARGRALFAPVSCQVEPGLVTSVVGPSGSGKSSLLAYACGFLRDPLRGSGSVRIGGEDVTQLPPQARRLGLLFQDSLLFPHLSVAGNLAFGLAHGGTRAERAAEIDAALESVDLAGFAQRDPASLSGGQQARVALLRVLLSKPRALLLDEPFGALDDATRERVRTLVFEQVQRHSLPTLLVTHDEQDVVAAGGPRVELVAH